MHTQRSNKIAMMQLFIALTCSFGCSLVEASILAKTRFSKPLKCLANFSTCLLVVSQLMHHGVCTCFPTINIRSFEETIQLFFFFLIGKNKLKKLVHKILKPYGCQRNDGLCVGNVLPRKCSLWSHISYFNFHQNNSA